MALGFVYRRSTHCHVAEVHGFVSQRFTGRRLTPGRLLPNSPSGGPAVKHAQGSLRRADTANRMSEDMTWTGRRLCLSSSAKNSPNCPPMIRPSTPKNPGKTESKPRSRNSESRRSPRHRPFARKSRDSLARPGLVTAFVAKLGQSVRTGRRRSCPFRSCRRGSCPRCASTRRRAGGPAR